jgi:hypothetical protein
MANHNECVHSKFSKFFLSWKGVIFTLALAGVSYYLLTEHRMHLAVALPYMILLACPLMHLFHGHDEHHHSNNNNNGNKE